MQTPANAVNMGIKRKLRTCTLCLNWLQASETVGLWVMRLQSLAKMRFFVWDLYGSASIWRKFFGHNFCPYKMLLSACLCRTTHCAIHFELSIPPTSLITSKCAVLLPLLTEKKLGPFKTTHVAPFFVRFGFTLTLKNDKLDVAISGTPWIPVAVCQVSFIGFTSSWVIHHAGSR